MRGGEGQGPAHLCERIRRAQTRRLGACTQLGLEALQSRRGLQSRDGLLRPRLAAGLLLLLHLLLHLGEQLAVGAAVEPRPHVPPDRRAVVREPRAPRAHGRVPHRRRAARCEPRDDRRQASLIEAAALDDPLR